MTKLLLTMGALFVLTATSANAAPVTIGFDSLPSGVFTSGTEDGFNLTGTESKLIGFASLVNGFSPDNYITGDNSLGDDWVLDLVESDGSAFEFVSLDSILGPATSGNVVTVRGYAGSDLVGTETFSPPLAGTETAQTFSAGSLSGIALTSLQIIGQVDPGDPSGFTVFVDDIILENDATVVPLPATVWLLISGLGVIGALSRKRRV